MHFTLFMQGRYTKVATESASFCNFPYWTIWHLPFAMIIHRQSIGEVFTFSTTPLAIVSISLAMVSTDWVASRKWHGILLPFPLSSYNKI